MGLTVLLVVLLFFVGLAKPVPVTATPTMYGAEGAGGGRLLIVDQTNGSQTIVGGGVPGSMSGLAFDSTGALFGSSPTSLFSIDPDTGAATLIGAAGLRLHDLSVQPGTEVLFGFGSIGASGRLVTIDKASGATTVVGVVPASRGGLAFAPDGTLYLAGITTGTLSTLNPADGSVLTSVLLSVLVDGLGIRPTDGALFGTGLGRGGVYLIDPSTGGATLVGTGPLAPSDLDFRPAAVVTPEPLSLVLSGTGTAVLWFARSRLRKRRL